MSGNPRHSVLTKLYTGEGGIDFVGRRKLWYAITGILLAMCILAIVFKGFTLGIDFQGGTKMTLPAGDLDEVSVSQTFQEATGIEPENTQIVGAGDSRMLEIQSVRLTDDQITQARQALFDAYKPVDNTGTPTPDAVGDSTVSESWGSTITRQMLISLVAFMVLIFLYIMIRFERDMSIAAVAALFVDAIAISGIYSLTGLEVTPATIIGLLTVLSFSLYDTVVVFDKVEENTAGFEHTTRRSYGELANLAVNQTVMRSIATTVISALPILALMIIAVWLMGVGTLKDLSVVQLIGVIEGTFSSVFLATPLLVSIKNRQKKHREHNERVAAAREKDAVTAGGGSEADSTAVVDGAVANDFDDQPDAEVRVFGDETGHGGEGHTPLGASWRPNRRS
ncbi:MAG: protein translocase subunit SecF [Corynebacterium sp.]|nr:protein translocase subunit SecF [Corynebacterium sp.]